MTARWRVLPSDDRGQASVEYLLVTAAVTLPIAAMTPTFIQMITGLYYRIAAVVALPIG